MYILYWSWTCLYICSTNPLYSQILWSHFYMHLRVLFFFYYTEIYYIHSHGYIPLSEGFAIIFSSLTESLNQSSIVPRIYVIEPRHHFTSIWIFKTNISACAHSLVHLPHICARKIYPHFCRLYILV